MKRSCAVSLCLVPAIALALVSCGPKSTRYCVDQDQKIRDDLDCQASSSGSRGFHWYYTGRPFGNGSRAVGGTTVTPSEGYVTRGGESMEGTTSRGVFGAAGEAHGAGAGE